MTYFLCLFFSISSCKQSVKYFIHIFNTAYTFGQTVNAVKIRTDTDIILTAKLHKMLNMLYNIVNTAFISVR